MPTLADINPKEGMEIIKVKSVIKLKHQNIAKTVVKISSFVEPSDIDFNEILGILPPLNYTAIQEVELQEEEPEEDRQLYERLKQIPDGLGLADILVSMHDDTLEIEEWINNTSPSNQYEMEIDEAELEEVLDDESEKKPCDIPAVQIDGYSQDELEDCIESDTEFNPKENKPIPKVLPKDVLKSREDILHNLGNRHSMHEEEKRDKIKRDFTNNITKKEWDKFKQWYTKENR